jgi:hypothetical protein
MRAFSVALLALILFACRGVMVQSGGIKVYEDEWNAATRDIGFRANVDLGDCPTREFTLLAKVKTIPTQVGVRGCGSTGIYERRRGNKITHKKNASWVLVSSSKAPVADLAPYQ